MLDFIRVSGFEARSASYEFIAVVQEDQAGFKRIYDKAEGLPIDARTLLAESLRIKHQRHKGIGYG